MLSLLLLSACARHHPYPEFVWGPLPPPPTEDCRHFEGSYRNSGEMVTMALPETRPLLTQTLFGRSTLGRDTRVSFALMTNETLNVTVWEGLKTVFTRALTSPGNFNCEEGRLVIRDRRLVNAPAVTIWQSVTITLSGTDDYLIAQVEALELGAVFIVPAGGQRSTNWYRFRRIDSNGIGQEHSEPRSNPVQVPSEDFVNCLASGERQWTYRSRCD